MTFQFTSPETLIFALNHIADRLDEIDDDGVASGSCRDAAVHIRMYVAALNEADEHDSVVPCYWALEPNKPSYHQDALRLAGIIEGGSHQ